MVEPPSSYVATLANQLAHHPETLDAAEDDLAILRGRLAIVTRFIHNPTYDATARQALAQDLQLPAPAPEKPHAQRSAPTTSPRQ